MNEQRTVNGGTEEAAPARQPALVVSGLGKTFKRRDGSLVSALRDVDLEISAGEFVVLLGPSGCGKTTLLRSLAGLEKPDEGHIALQQSVVFDSATNVDVPTERRGLGMVFQSYALWPHMTAAQNVAYPLQSRKPRPSKAEIQRAVERSLTLVGIPELVGQHPGQMSGGQQQRVALARALAGGSKVILFDEPLSNVDAKVRQQLRRELQLMQKELGFAAVYVTHDQAEAMELADRICVMSGGRILQNASPSEVYDRPTSHYVANFMGDVNTVHGTVLARISEGRVRVETEFGRLEVEGGSGAEVGASVAVIFRPEVCQLAASSTSSKGWAGTVRSSVYLGNSSQHIVSVGASDFTVWSPGSSRREIGEEITLLVSEDHMRSVSL